MAAFLLNIIIILLVMKVLFKYMYPKPPANFLPKEGDDTSIRKCSDCGHTLATYRGILEKQGEREYFFCNDEHKKAFEQENH